MAEQDIVLFDGVCGLCEWSVQFILAHDMAERFRFVPLQGQNAPRLLRQHGLDPGRLESVVLIENGQVYTRSAAAMRIVRHLRFPVSLLWVGILVPPLIRDAMYDWISRHRYQLVGRRTVCRLPSRETADRFLA